MRRTRLREEDNIYRKIREYLNMSQEEIARALGISLRTWVRWEAQDIEQPLYENRKRIIELIKKHGHKEFRRDFLKQTIYDAPIVTVGRKEREIINDIKENWEKIKNAPILKKIFEEHPEYKKLSFDEILEKYTKDRVSFNALFLLNSLPLHSSFNKQHPKFEKPQKVKKIDVVVRNKIKRRPRKNSRHRNKNSEKQDESGSDDDSDDWEGKSEKLWGNYYKRPLTDAELEEIQTNMYRFFSLLREWYNKIEQGGGNF